MRIVIIGGHIGPALAVIEKLPKNIELLFIGRKNAFEGDTSESFEYLEINRRGIPFSVLKAGRMQRGLSRYTLQALFRSPSGVYEAVKILSVFKPDIVLGFGGYLSLTVGVAAYLRKIPFVIHEQTLSAGLANKLLAKLATKVCISWENSRTFFPKQKTIMTGIPLRTAITKKVETSKKTNLPRLYITGGSSGSHIINTLVLQILPELLNIASVIHQTGNAYQGRDYELLVAKKKLLPVDQQKRYDIVHFLSDSDAAKTLSQADLVVSRSGINTVSELLYLEKPSLCIPLMHGQKGEQEENARFLATSGLAEVLLQKNADEKTFLATIESMLAKRDSYKLRSGRASLHIDGAAERIIAVLSDVVNKTPNKKT